MEAESEDDTVASQTSLERPAPHRGNTMVHVCWHRNTSVSMVDFSVAVEVPSKPGPAPPASPFPFTVSDPVLYPNSPGLSLWKRYSPLLQQRRLRSGRVVFIKRTELTLSRPFPDSSLWDLDQDFSSNIHWWAIEELPDLSYTVSLIFGFLKPLSDCRHRWGCVWLRFQPLHKTSHPHKL